MKKIIPIILSLTAVHVNVYGIGRGKHNSYAKRSSYGF